MLISQAPFNDENMRMKVADGDKRRPDAMDRISAHIKAGMVSEEALAKLMMEDARKIAEYRGEIAGRHPSTRDQKIAEAAVKNPLTGPKESHKRKAVQAMIDIGKPFYTGDITKATGLPSGRVSCTIRTLMGKGLVEKVEGTQRLYKRSKVWLDLEKDDG